MLRSILLSLGAKRGYGLAPKVDLHLTHSLLLQWLLLAWFLLYCIYMTWQYDFFSLLLEYDPTYISSLILIIFFLASGYIGYRAIHLSREIDLGLQLIADSLSGGNKASGNFIQARGLIAEYFIQAQLTKTSSPAVALNIGTLSNLLDQKVNDHHEAGWFTVNLLLKLGLLGTVVGFILMINALTEIKTIEYSNLKGLISEMALGMGIALTTTVVGLVTSLLLGIQCLFLDRAADFIMTLASQSLLTSDSSHEQ